MCELADIILLYPPCYDPEDDMYPCSELLYNSSLLALMLFSVCVHCLCSFGFSHPSCGLGYICKKRKDRWSHSILIKAKTKAFLFGITYTDELCIIRPDTLQRNCIKNWFCIVFKACLNAMNMSAVFWLLSVHIWFMVWLYELCRKQ